MATDTVTPWMTGWDLENPIKLGFARVDATAGTWESGPAPYFEYRTLDLAKAAEGKMTAWHIRGTSTDGDWQADDVDFQFFYLLKGSMTITFENGEKLVLMPESSITIPALYRYQLSDISDDFEALEVAAPDAYSIVWGKDTKLPERASTLDPDRSPVWNHESPDEYHTGGLRNFFEYRDLGTKAATDGRVHIHVVHGMGTPYAEGTGWHYHSWAQWFMVIGGNADIRVEQSRRHTLGYGDSYCIGSGPEQRHFVDQVSGDYKVIEMCVPGWSDATPVDAPDGADD